MIAVAAITTALQLRGLLPANFAKVTVLQVSLYQWVTENKKSPNVLYVLFLPLFFERSERLTYKNPVAPVVRGTERLRVLYREEVVAIGARGFLIGPSW